MTEQRTSREPRRIYFNQTPGNNGYLISNQDTPTRLVFAEKLRWTTRNRLQDVFQIPEEAGKYFQKGGDPRLILD